MAETLSVVAASLQIVELFAKIVVRTKRLANQLKDAPDEIRRKLQTVEDFHSLCISYQHVLTQNSAQIDAHVPREDIKCITDLLCRAEAKVESLETILFILRPQSADGRLESCLKAAKTIHKGKDMTAHIRELCEVKAQIDSFFGRHIWSLVVAHSTKTETSFAGLQASQSQNDAAFSDIRRHQNDDRTTLEGIKMAATEISNSQQSLSQGVDEVKTNINAGIASLHDSSQVLETVVRTTGSDIEAQINRGFEGFQSSLASLCLSDDSIRRLTLQIATHGQVQPASNTVTCSASPVLFCPCQRLGRAASLLTVGSITIVSREFGAHQPGCRYHGQSNAAVIERRLHVMLNARHGRYMTAFFTRFAMTASSFFSGVLLFPNIVDNLDLSAPGFIHMDEAETRLWEMLEVRSPSHIRTEFPPEISPELLQKCRQVLNELHSRLLEDFNVSRKWCRIQRSNGMTLLHSLGNILTTLWTVQDEVSDIVGGIIRLLIQGGTLVNATVLSDFDAHDTALSYLTIDLSDLDVNSKSKTRFLQLFSQNNVPAFSSNSTTLDYWMTVRLFIAIPDLAIEYGCSRLCLAVIMRDRNELGRLLQCGHKVNDTSQHFSALSFALEWPAGVKILLAAGADTFQAIQHAIVYQNIPSLKLLLEANGPLFEPEEASNARACQMGFKCEPELVDSLINLAIWRRWLQPDFDHEIFPVLIKALSLARNDLMKLAMANLSISQLKDLGWTNVNGRHHLIDSAAGQTLAKLKEMGVKYGANLNPGRAKSIYHSGWMNADVAEMLFQAGFTEIDVFDQEGITPLLLDNLHLEAENWADGPQMLLWLLEHGAKNMVFSTLNNNTFIHKLAANLGQDWSTADSTESISEQITQWLPMILKKSAKLLRTQPKDLCQCSCSKEGCSPIQSLIKHMLHSYRWYGSGNIKTYTWWDTRQRLFELWNNSCPEDLTGSPSFYSFCRIELFERLGMRHTCCKFMFIVTDDYSEDFFMLPYMGFNFHLPEPSEAAEFRAEDAFSRLKLEGLMALYEEIALEHSELFEEFWKTWWTVMENFVPQAVFDIRPPGSRLYGECLPIPLETLEATLGEIRSQVTRRMVEMRRTNAVIS